jgi:hypothetical protein
MNRNNSAENNHDRKSARNKTILVIDACLPQYDKDSGSNRMQHLLRMFRNLGYNVLFFPDNGKPTEPYFTLLKDLGIEVIYKSRSSRTWQKELKQCLHRVDICWLSRPDLNEKYSYIFHINPTIKWIYDSVDLHYVRLGREVHLLTDERMRLRLQTRADAFEKLEVSLAKRADVTIAITTTEADELARRGARLVKVVPNIHVAQESTNTFEQRTGIMFIGGFAHQPNIDAVEWLIKDIMPSVWKALPDVKVYLVGSNPTQEVCSLANAQVIVTGYVHDVSSYFNDSRIFVAPLRYGAGMKGKIGQALEYALPVVSTKIGTEGMNLQHGTHVIEAMTIPELQHSILELYTNKALWNKLHANALSALHPLLFDIQQQNVQKILESLYRPYKVTIITVVKNGEATLQELIDSVEKHKTFEVEFLIFDGQSTDGSLHIVERNSHVVDQYVTLQDSGIYDAMNKAVQLARGEFFLFLGADDLLCEGFMQMLPLLKDAKTIYYGGAYMGDKRVSKPYSAYQLTKEHICHQTIFYPQAVFEKYSYDTNYKVFADYQLNLKCFTDPEFKQHYEDLMIAQFKPGGFSDFTQDLNYTRDKELWYGQLLSSWDYVRYLRRRLGYTGLITEMLQGLKPYTLPKKDSERLGILFLNDDFTTDRKPIDPKRTFKMLKMLSTLSYDVTFLTSEPYFKDQNLSELNNMGVKIVHATITSDKIRVLLNQVEFVWFLGYKRIWHLRKSIMVKRHIKMIFDASAVGAPNEPGLIFAKKADVTIVETAEWKKQLETRGIFHFKQPDVTDLRKMFNNLR